MKNPKFMAGSLFFCSIAMGVGMILNIHIYWSVIDILVVLICAANGVLLLKNK